MNRILRRVLNFIKQWSHEFFKSYMKAAEHELVYQGVRMEPDIEFEELPNPNYNSRPAPPDGIVIHAAGYYIKDDDGEVWFGPDFIKEHGYSYHALVDGRGKVYVTVDREDRAWHAGKSEWKGQRNLNDTFIGFCALVRHTPLGYGEFLRAIDREDTYTEAQYNSLASLCVQAIKDYPDITLDRIVRHSTVSGPEIRDDYKLDPGKGFDMKKLKIKIDEWL